MSDSPAVILYDASGNAMAVQDGAAIGSARSVLVAGKDSTTARVIKVDATGRVVIDGSSVTQPVSAASLPLPAGAATQTTLDALLTALTARINLLGQKTMALSTPITMASDQTAIPITTSGAGEEATYTALASAVVLGNNKSLLGLFNPAASEYTIKLREIYIRNAQTTAVTGVAANIQLHALRTAASLTAGTAITPIAHDSNDTLPVGLICMTGGTATGEIATPLDVMRISSDEWGPGTLDVEAHHHGFENYMPARVKRDSVMKPFVCRSGEGIHIKCATNTTAGSFDVILIFTKV